jgi:hypothetical protein
VGGGDEVSVGVGGRVEVAVCVGGTVGASGVAVGSSGSSRPQPETINSATKSSRVTDSVLLISASLARTYSSG